MKTKYESRSVSTHARGDPTPWCFTLDSHRELSSYLETIEEKRLGVARLPEYHATAFWPIKDLCT